MPDVYDPLLSTLEKKGYFAPNYLDKDFFCNFLHLEDIILGTADFNPPDDTWSAICFGKENGGRLKGLDIQMIFNVDYIRKDITLESIKFAYCNRYKVFMISNLSDIPACGDQEYKLFCMLSNKELRKTIPSQSHHNRKMRCINIGIQKKR